MVSTYNGTVTQYPCICVLPIQWIPGDLSPGLKRPGREADHSPPTSAEVKKRGSIHQLPHMSSWRGA
jgi:hypothetical protein